MPGRLGSRGSHVSSSRVDCYLIRHVSGKELAKAILPELDFSAGAPFQLEDHDLVFFFTDGLVEAHCSGQPMFGTERTLEVIREHRAKPASEIIDAVYAAVRKHLGTSKPHDDITLIVAKVGPRP